MNARPSAALAGFVPNMAITSVTNAVGVIDLLPFISRIMSANIAGGDLTFPCFSPSFLRLLSCVPHSLALQAASPECGLGQKNMQPNALAAS